MTAAIDRLALLVGQNDRGSKLKVVHDRLRPGCLLVDCEAVMSSPNDVRYWILWPEPDGEWVHAESATKAPLYDVLRSIAACYDAIPDSLGGDDL